MWLGLSKSVLNRANLRTISVVIEAVDVNCQNCGGRVYPEGRDGRVFSRKAIKVKSQRGITSIQLVTLLNFAVLACLSITTTLTPAVSDSFITASISLEGGVALGRSNGTRQDPSISPVTARGGGTEEGRCTPNSTNPRCNRTGNPVP